VTRRNKVEMASAGILIRPPVAEDLPAIHDLLRQSYAAMADHYPDQKERFVLSAETAIQSGDLEAAHFLAEYVTSAKSTSRFWVACDSELGVVGCVGLKRLGADDGELCRMSVSSANRSKGVGSLLVQTLVQFCRAHHILRIQLTTANPMAARLYDPRICFRLEI
jgi:GNAT superfamily N-acetyltransferase